MTYETAKQTNFWTNMVRFPEYRTWCSYQPQGKPLPTYEQWLEINK